MIPERMTSAAGALGMGRAALEIAARYSDRRKAFGQKIRTFQGVNFKIAESAAALDAAAALVYAAARAVDAGAPAGTVRRLVSEAKKVATETAWRVVNDAMQILGGIGYTNVYPVERLLRDTRLIMIWTGTSEVMNGLIQHEYYKEVLGGTGRAGRGGRRRGAGRGEGVRVGTLATGVTCRPFGVVVECLQGRRSEFGSGVDMATEDSRLYIQRANLDLRAAQSSLENGYFGVAVSRAYYAMFYALSAVLASKGLTRSKHSAVHAAFGEHFVKAGLVEPKYFRTLKSAFQARTDFDYDAAACGDPDTAVLAVRNADEFVARLEQLL